MLQNEYTYTIVINGIPTKLCLRSVIWNICLKGFSKSFICSVVLAGIQDK